QGGSKGNGAATRIAPLGLFYWDSSVLNAKAEEPALVTHRHTEGRDGTVL
ncbi:MAG: ADP-ribosylglycohydrolase family protein, partial [Spirochaetales bacterium]|nr:ADP-ribosylglycohydrolase family protein [Spirochaetales bacterium]